MVDADREVDAAAHEVVEAEVDLGHAQAQRGLAALGAERGALLVGEVAVEVVVAELLGPAGRLVAGVDLVGGRVALVEVAGGLQPLDHVGVDLAALRLPVGLVRAADADALVPVEAEPGERVEELLVALLAVARGIGVLDAEHEACRRCAGRTPS